MRTVREMPQTPDWAAVIASQMGKVRNFLGAQDHQRVFLDPNSHFCLVDDVGLIGAVGIVEDVSAHVHMTFWDKRMRGREVLASMIVGYLMNVHNLGGIWTGVPKKHNAVIGFAKRVGFKPFYEDDKVVGLLFLRRDY